MNKSELQIGDYVIASNQIAKVVAIQEDDFVVVSFMMGKDDRLVVWTGHLKPIKLNDYILEKNGFSKTWYKGNKDRKVWERPDFVFGEDMSIAIGKQMGWQNTSLYNMHDLQHAMRLCHLDELVLCHDDYEHIK